MPEFLRWTPPFLNLDLSIDANRGFSLNKKKEKANSVDPDETACDEPFHLKPHCLLWYWFWSARLKWS